MKQLTKLLSYKNTFLLYQMQVRRKIIKKTSHIIFLRIENSNNKICIEFLVSICYVIMKIKVKTRGEQKSLDYFYFYLSIYEIL